MIDVAYMTRKTGILMLAICLGACAATGPAQQQQVQAQPGTATEGYWWNCRFSINWPANTAPDMTVDLMLAHAVVAPVLERYRDKLAYWRFHRRAARDAAGHQFSFMYYSSKATAATINKELHNSDILQAAISAGMVTAFIPDDTRSPANPGTAATSDPGWSRTIRENWPVFIMGVSETWLGLIDSNTPEISGDSDIVALLELYRDVSQDINELWKLEGQRAFLHHLNAVFGYEPVLIENEVRF